MAARAAGGGHNQLGQLSSGQLLLERQLKRLERQQRSMLQRMETMAECHRQQLQAERIAYKRHVRAVLRRQVGTDSDEDQQPRKKKTKQPRRTGEACSAPDSWRRHDDEDDDDDDDDDMGGGGGGARGRGRSTAEQLRAGMRPAVNAASQAGPDGRGAGTGRTRSGGGGGGVGAPAASSMSMDADAEGDAAGGMSGDDDDSVRMRDVIENLANASIKASSPSASPGKRAASRRRRDTTAPFSFLTGQDRLRAHRSFLSGGGAPATPGGGRPSGPCG